jgi:hypothetical protein
MSAVGAKIRTDNLFRLGVTFALAWVIIGALEVKGSGDDWRLYLDAGRHVGSMQLITEAHFVYLPAAAWIMWPFAQLPLVAGYFSYVAIMVGLATGAAWLASKTYGISLPLAVLMALAWFPFTIAVSLGQNSPVALFLTTVVIFGVVKRDDVLAGLATALLLYKPNDAIPFLLLFLILRQWRSLLVAAASIPVWYVLSVAATGNWAWPLPFSHMFSAWYHHDAVIDGVFSINIPGILLSLGVPNSVAIAVGVAVLALTVPLLAGVSRTESSSIVPLIGVVCSPHAYGYEAILALPALWLISSRPNALRTACIVISYCIAPLYLYARAIHFDVLAIPILGAVIAWIGIRLRDRMAMRLARLGG